MIKVCAACSELRDVSMHTASGWICNPCERSASTIVQVYVINGQRFHKLLKGVEVKNDNAEPRQRPGAIRKEN